MYLLVESCLDYVNLFLIIYPGRAMPDLNLQVGVLVIAVYSSAFLF